VVQLVERLRLVGLKLDGTPAVVEVGIGRLARRAGICFVQSCEVCMSRYFELVVCGGREVL